MIDVKSHLENPRQDPRWRTINANRRCISSPSLVCNGGSAGPCLEMIGSSWFSLDEGKQRSDSYSLLRGRVVVHRRPLICTKAGLIKPLSHERIGPFISSARAVEPETQDLQCRKVTRSRTHKKQDLESHFGYGSLRSLWVEPTTISFLFHVRSKVEVTGGKPTRLQLSHANRRAWKV